MTNTFVSLYGLQKSPVNQAIVKEFAFKQTKVIKKKKNTGENFLKML